MSSIELDARRAEIIRQLFDTESMEVLDSVKRSLSRALHRESKELSVVAKEDLTPYTMEEIDRWMDEGEAEEADGLVYTSEEVHQMMEKEFPWLCK